MHCFNDKNGKQWTIDINVGTARRVNAECGIDLVNLITIAEDGKADTAIMQKVIDDIYLLAAVICSLCKSQREKENLSEEQFAELFDADTISAATDALMKEVINFSQPAKRKMLTLIYEKTQNFRAKAEQHLEEILQSKEFENELESQLNNLLTNTQE